LKIKKRIKVIGLDADDTLWDNEIFFRRTEKHFCQLLLPYNKAINTLAELTKTERKNMDLYGYGIKAFILSMIETAIHISQGQISGKEIAQIIQFGREQLRYPVRLLEGVEETLQQLSTDYRLILVTKGDLLDQNYKLDQSGLRKQFHHIEIMYDKTPLQYKRMLRRIDVEASHFLMIGNSIKSDILPPLELGAYAIHVPFHTTWEYEIAEEPIHNPHFHKVRKLTETLDFLL